MAQVATDATYQVYQDYNGVSFPNVIEIKRPQEEYSIRLTVDKLVINEPLSDDQFALQQPPGSQVGQSGPARTRARQQAPRVHPPR